ncbi:unnamed protein product [Caenorhabditis sp. 36 PRJEB53466]|nr:unnamed protein product [Caenorhabditis sp. 36 PRJEB53466]
MSNRKKTPSRDKENAESADRSVPIDYSSDASTTFSLTNPQPSAEDYQRYDEDRNLRYRARDLRIAQRRSRTPESADPGPSSSFSRSPSRRDEVSPVSRGGSGVSEHSRAHSCSQSHGRVSHSLRDVPNERFVHKSPQNNQRERASPQRQPTFPVEERRVYSRDLNSRMEHNFTRMHDLIQNGSPRQAAREQVLVETAASVRCPRGADRRVIHSRSSSQPPPIDTFNAPGPSSSYLNQRAATPTQSVETAQPPEPVHRSYVDTLIAAHQMQMRYADVTAAQIDRQQAKLERMQNLFEATMNEDPTGPHEAPEEVRARAFHRGQRECQEQRKREVTASIKDRCRKVMEVQRNNYGGRVSRYVVDLERNIDSWFPLPLPEFDQRTALELAKLLKLLLKSVEKTLSPWEIDEAVRRSHNRRSIGRQSNVMRVLPTNSESSSSEEPRTRPQAPTPRKSANHSTVEAEKSARRDSFSDPLRFTSPYIERLDLSSLRGEESPRRPSSSSSSSSPPTNDLYRVRSASQASAPPPARPISLRRAASMEARAHLPPPPASFFQYIHAARARHASQPPRGAAPAPQQQEHISDLNNMLDSISLHDRSLDSIGPPQVELRQGPLPFTHFPPADAQTQRSERESFHEDSARRFSNGASHILAEWIRMTELKKKEEEEAEGPSDRPVTPGRDQTSSEFEAALSAPLPPTPAVSREAPKLQKVASEESSSTPEAPKLSDESSPSSSSTLSSTSPEVPKPSSSPPPVPKKPDVLPSTPKIPSSSSSNVPKRPDTSAPPKIPKLADQSSSSNVPKRPGTSAVAPSAQPKIPKLADESAVPPSTPPLKTQKRSDASPPLEQIAEQPDEEASSSSSTSSLPSPLRKAHYPSPRVPRITLTGPTSSSSSPSPPDSDETPDWNLDSPTEMAKKDYSAMKFEEEEDLDATLFEHEKEEKTPTPPVNEEEDEGDEHAQFRNRDEFEDSTLEEEDISAPAEKEPEVPRAAAFADVSFNDSANDSSFLLNDRPMPRLKSIMDSDSPSSAAPPRPPPPAPADSLRADTPRAPPSAQPANVVEEVLNNTTMGETILEEWCQGQYIEELAPTMIRQALENQSALRGADWIRAQQIWQPPSFYSMNISGYDHFDIFDSFSILIWGAVVDLLNRKYLKFGRPLTADEEKRFAADVIQMLKYEYGTETKHLEWSEQIKLNKRLEGINPLALDYRFENRRNMLKEEQQEYQWQQIKMKVISERYQLKKLEDELNVVYAEESEKVSNDTMSPQRDEVGTSDV